MIVAPRTELVPFHPVCLVVWAQPCQLPLPPVDAAA